MSVQTPVTLETLHPLLERHGEVLPGVQAAPEFESVRVQRLCEQGQPAVGGAGRAAVQQVRTGLQRHPGRRHADLLQVAHHLLARHQEVQPVL